MPYATMDDILAYGLPHPENEFITQRASELIDYAVLPNKIDQTNSIHVLAAKNAVCAQVEFWLETDESLAITGSPDSFSVGNFRQQGKIPTLAPRARNFLLTAGLLYRGVKI